MNNDFRIEKDSIGEREIPQCHYWGIHTLRAIENFPISNKRVNIDLLKAYLDIKRSCARVNTKLGYLERNIGDGIVKICEEMSEKDLFSNIIVDAYQGGAGTSTNLNICEVIANKTLEYLGYEKGDYTHCDPFDHVNLHQSTNDTYPTALRIAIYRLLLKLEGKITHLQEMMQFKEREFSKIVKISRTELMDAVPMTLGRTFAAWADVLSRDRWRIFKCTERIRVINLGGTAIGTGIGAPRDYILNICQELKLITGLPLSRAENLIDATQNQDAIVEVMGMLKTHAMNLMKIASDLRLLNMGPDCGIGEIQLPPVQGGSSIMPYKFNPVISEMVTQVSIQVAAFDQAISWAVGSGQMELNAFLPLVAMNILEALQLLEKANEVLAEKCIQGITAKPDSCKIYAETSRAVTTVLVPHVGYKQATEVARLMESSGLDFIEAAQKITGFSRETCQTLITPEEVNALGFERREITDEKK